MYSPEQPTPNQSLVPQLLRSDGADRTTENEKFCKHESYNIYHELASNKTTNHNSSNNWCWWYWCWWCYLCWHHTRRYFACSPHCHLTILHNTNIQQIFRLVLLFTLIVAGNALPPVIRIGK